MLDVLRLSSCHEHLSSIVASDGLLLAYPPKNLESSSILVEQAGAGHRPYLERYNKSLIVDDSTLPGSGHRAHHYMMLLVVRAVTSRRSKAS